MIEPFVVPCAYTVSAVSFNVALETTLSLKLFAVFVCTAFVCNDSISVLAFVKLFLIAVKLSLNPCEELSFPATGNVPSTLPGTMLLAIIKFLYFEIQDIYHLCS